MTSDAKNFGWEINLGVSAADAIFSTGVPVPEVVGSYNATYSVTIGDVFNNIWEGASSFFGSMFGPAAGPNENGARYPIDSLDLNPGVGGLEFDAGL